MLSDSEQDILFRWLHEQTTQEEQGLILRRLTMLTDNELAEALEQVYRRFEPRQEAVFTDDQKARMLEKSLGQAQVIHTRHRQWRAVAAAVIGLLLIRGAYFIYTHNSRPDIAKAKQETQVHDVPPGGNRATLTLSNGSTIVLDSAGIGTIAQQGSATVRKSDSGRLAYNVILQTPAEIMYNIVTTPRGGQYQLTLSDGTKVWLNAASSIRFPVLFIGKERSVEVTGEAYFEVAHNDKQPFKVKAGEQIVEDIGTAFNINAYPDEGATRTTLIEGLVKVSQGKDAAVLKPGEQTIAGAQQFKVQHSVDVNAVMAWKNGLFKFNQSDIQTVMRQISRWYDVQVIYPNGIPKDRYWGAIRRDLSLAAVFKVLQESGAHFIIGNKNVTVLP